MREAELEYALPARLAHVHHPRALQVLAQQHHEGRRLRH